MKPPFLNEIRNTVSHALRTNVWILEGVEKSSGKEFAAVYAGLEPQKEYFAGLAFGPDRNERFIGREWLWKIRELARREAVGAALLVYELEGPKEWFHPGHSALRSPVWVRLEMPLDPERLSSTARHQFKDMRRRIRKYALTASFSRSEADFDFFYRSLYVPSVKMRHGKSALVHDYGDLKKKFLSRGELVFIHMEGRRIAGSLLDFSEAQGHSLYSGVLDGSPDLVKMGAAHVLYHFEAERFREKAKSATVHMGHCRAFLGDGILRYKVQMGGNIARAHYKPGGWLYFGFLKDTPALRSFLCENPFVAVGEKGRYSAAVFTEELLPAANPDAFLDARNCRGLKEVTVYSFRESGSDFVQSENYDIRVLPAAALMNTA